MATREQREAAICQASEMVRKATHPWLRRATDEVRCPHGVRGVGSCAECARPIVPEGPG